MSECKKVLRSAPLSLTYMRPVRPPNFSAILILNFARAAIIIQIWRESEHTRRLRSIFTIRAVAESGVLYTLTSIAALSAIFIRHLPNGSPYPLMMATAIVRRTSNGDNDNLIYF